MIESRTPRLYELLHAYGAAKFKDGRHPKRSSASAGRPPLAYGVLLDEDADFFVSEMRFRLTSSSIAFGSRVIDSPPRRRRCATARGGGSHAAGGCRARAPAMTTSPWTAPVIGWTSASLNQRRVPADLAVAPLRPEVRGHRCLRGTVGELRLLRRRDLDPFRIIVLPRDQSKFSQLNSWMRSNVVASMAISSLGVPLEGRPASRNARRY